MLAKLLLVLGLFTFWGCASYTDKTSEIRSDYLNGHYEEALRKLEELGLRQEGSSELLYYLEKAMILDRQGERVKARKHLLTADQIVDKLFTTSVINTAATFVVNESAQDYSGEDYEKVAIHTMLALSFIQDQELEAAGVEARKINTVLRQITKEYDDRYRSYSEDAFARYLAGIIYEARDEIDDAIIDYRKALKLYSQDSYHNFYRGSIPRGLVQALYALALRRGRSSLQNDLEKSYPGSCKEIKAKLRPKKTFAQLIVIHEYGHIAAKQAKEFIVPFGRQVVRFSFPYIPRSSHHGIARTGFELNNKSFIAADNVADLNAIAHYSLEDRRGRMLLKGAARLLTKGQLTEQAYQKLGPLGGLAANVYSAVTETADTRSWTFLPEAFYVSRKWVPAGKHVLKIQNGGKLSQVLAVELKPGEIKIIRDFAQ